MVTSRSWLAILVRYTDMIRLWGELAPEPDRVKVVIVVAVGIGSFSPVEKHVGTLIGSCIIFGHTRKITKVII